MIEGRVDQQSFKVLSLPFGKHQGRPITRVPKDYLEWLSREPSTTYRDGVNYVDEAKKELERRNPDRPKDGIHPSLHAIDRFSTRFKDRWDGATGMASYLSILSKNAWENGKTTRREVSVEEVVICKKWNDMTFVFLCDDMCNAHTLKTVM